MKMEHVTVNAPLTDITVSECKITINDEPRRSEVSISIDNGSLCASLTLTHDYAIALAEAISKIANGIDLSILPALFF